MIAPCKLSCFKATSVKGLFIAVAALTLTSCAALNNSVGYYWQSVRGHMSLLHNARPISEMIADPTTSAALRNKLQFVREVRTYASQELGLPDNGSYQKYVDLKRPFVVWNVVAAPELSLQLRQWCFVVVGCVTYRGYYSKADADAFANVYREQGDDVQVGGVPAYSTLGYLDDPVLSSFIHYPEGELARLIFHELSHQVVYIQNDTTFNESFATAFETIAVEQWLAQKGNAVIESQYRAFAQRRSDFVELLKRYRKKLEDAYQVETTSEAKRAAKQAIFTALKAEYETIKRDQWGGFKGYDRFFAQDLGNAHLAAVATYTDQVPGFLALARQVKAQVHMQDKTQGNDAGSAKPEANKNAAINFEAFFTAVRELSRLDKATRDERLKNLAQ
jgi:predicted aminopeptidase